MTPIIDTARRAAARLAAALLVGLLALPATEAAAQQVNPTAQSVQEEMLLQELREGPVSGRVSLPNERAANLIAPGNRDWSNMRRGTLFTITAVFIVGMIVLLAAFYLVKGRVPIESGRSGRGILRFNAIERFAHWLTGVSFIVLALTGLNITLGRSLLLPLVGEEAFGTWSIWLKLAHNYIAWPFMIGLVLIFALWIKDNIPNKMDVTWIKQFGGFFKRGVHVPAWRFNAGQKLIFWSVIVGGAVMSWTGIVLLFPYLSDGLDGWQLAQSVHGIGAAVMIAIILGHIYIGTIGMEGAFDAMGNGTVDENWAKEHHSLWVEQELGRGKAEAQAGPAGRPVAPAE